VRAHVYSAILIFLLTFDLMTSSRDDDLRD